MIRLICIDVDGTLVGSNGGVLPEVWRAADRARERGIHLAICSGRPGFGITREYAERLDPDGWHIFQNGASVLHVGHGESRSVLMDPDTVTMLIGRARTAQRALELYGDTSYVIESDAPRARMHAGLLGVPFSHAPYETFTDPVVRAQWLLTDDEAPEVLAEPHPGLNVSPSTSPMTPGMVFVNLTPAGIDKAFALRAVAKAYGVPLDDVMMVGDGSNDAEAMRVAGHAVAMANAEPEAMAAARHVVGHVDSAGLVDALELALAGGIPREGARER